jgi:rhodanese-related sulfurtransferase
MKHIKYTVIIIIGTLFIILQANALDWNDLLTISSKSIKTFFLTEITEPVPVPVGEIQTKPGDCNFPVNLKPAEAKYFIETQKPVIIDVRTSKEYASGHVANAVNMDFYAPDFQEKIEKLDKNAKYLVYCKSGKRSTKTLELMAKLGFKHSHQIEGGITAWIQAGFPTVIEIRKRI